MLSNLYLITLYTIHYYVNIDVYFVYVQFFLSVVILNIILERRLASRRDCVP